MQVVNECFDIVKKDYLNYLKKEKIFEKSKKEKIISLKKIYIPMSFWIEKKYKKKRKLYLQDYLEDRDLERLLLQEF